MMLCRRSIVSHAPPTSTEHRQDIEVDRDSQPVYADAMAQASTTPTTRLVLCAVLHDVSPIVARVIAVPDHLEIHELHEIFLSLLG